jgi:integrase
VAYAYKKGRRWYVGWRDELGRQLQKKTNAATKAEAQRIGQDLERRAERVRLGLEAPPPPPTTFAELAKRYIEEIVPFKRSHATIEGRIRLHLVPTLGKLHLSELTAERGAAELQRLLSAKRNELSAQSVEHLRRTCRVLFNFATRVGLMRGTNPAGLVVKLKVPPRPIRFLEEESIPRVLLAVPERWRPLFAIAVYTGARKGELLGLRRRDVDLSRGTIRIEHSYDGPTKSSKPRAVPIPPELVPFLQNAMNRSTGELLFAASHGEMRARHTDLVSILRRALVKAGLIEAYEHVCRRKACGFKERRQDATGGECPRCRFRLWVRCLPPRLRFHDLRSTFGTHAYEATGDVRFVQAVLGHADPRLTEDRYSSLRQNRLIEQAKKVQFGAGAYPALTAPEHSARHSDKPSGNSESDPEDEMVRPAGVEPAAFGFGVRPRRDHVPSV